MKKGNSRESLELNSESPLYVFATFPGDTSVLQRKQWLEKVTCLNRASHRLSPCILNSQRPLLRKIILQPKEESFWLEIHSYWYNPFLPESKIQSCV